MQSPVSNNDCNIHYKCGTLVNQKCSNDIYIAFKIRQIGISAVLLVAQPVVGSGICKGGSDGI